jgi:hypothetical protein
MERITGNITIKHILEDNNNWQRFYEKYSDRIRDAIPWNIDKIFACRTGKLGFHKYECLDCGETLTVPHSCKSRLCSSCGTIATNNWISSSLNEFLDVPYQHLVFTVPEQLRSFIFYNRKALLSVLFKSASETIQPWLKQNKSYTPGIIMVLHTFGRDLKFNPHIHMLITCGGLSIDKSKWIPCSFIPHQVLKPIWRYQIINALRTLFKKQLLKFPPKHQNLSCSVSFNKFLNTLYNQPWYVYIGRKLDSAKITIQYIGRYTKRPVIAEARITSYDGHSVEFFFEDHATNQKHTVKLTVERFIINLIRHIPDKHFRQIRYTGIFASRIRTASLSLARKLLCQIKKLPCKNLSWRDRKIMYSGRDPRSCPICGLLMSLTTIGYFNKNNQLIEILIHSPP